MEPGRWWYGDIVATATFSYAIGFTHEGFATSIALSLALESISNAVAGYGGFAWTLILATLVTTVGAIGVGGGFKLHVGRAVGQPTRETSEDYPGGERRPGNGAMKTAAGSSLLAVRQGGTEQWLVFMIESAAYLACRQIASETSFSGFPIGSLMSLGILCPFFLFELAVLRTAARDESDARERTGLFYSLAIAATIAHLTPLAIYASLRSPNSTAGMPPGGPITYALASVFACMLLALTTQFVARRKGLLRISKRRRVNNGLPAELRTTYPPGAIPILPPQQAAGSMQWTYVDDQNAYTTVTAVDRRNLRRMAYDRDPPERLSFRDIVHRLLFGTPVRE